jgi:hypothetical protein
MGDQPDPKRVQNRAENLLPEEQEVGSDDPAAQAEQILAESDARTEHTATPGDKPIEHRESQDTVAPPD